MEHLPEISTDELITQCNLRMGEIAVEQAALTKEWDELLTIKLQIYQRELSQ